MARTIRQCVGGLLLVTMAWAAEAQERIAVDVSFEVQALHFSSVFDETQLAQLHAHTASAIAGTLGRHVQFVDFTTDTGAAHRLAVTLARADGKDDPGVSEFGFHLHLQGGTTPEGRRSYLVFRTIDRFFEPIGSAEALTREIEEAVDRSDHRALVTDLLSDIPIAEDARFLKDELSWMIERDRLALCIGFDSRLRVLGQVPFGAGGVRRDWFPAVVIDVIDPQNRIFAETADPTVRDRLRGIDADRLTVERVAVADYFLCQRPVPASVVDFSAAGATP